MTPICPICHSVMTKKIRDGKDVDKYRCKKQHVFLYRSQAGKKKFYMFERRDSSLIYRRTLESAGYIKVDDPRSADFLLYDLEQDCYLPTIRHFLEKKKPIFTYPHSANSWYFWDGIVKEYPVSCNFVLSGDIQAAMRSYGYKSRIEPCGFPFSDVTPHKPMPEQTLLYAPMHTMGSNGMDSLQPPASFELNRQTLDRVIQMAPFFSSVTIRYGKSFEASGMYDPHIKNIHFEKATLKSRDAVRSIQQHGTVIAAGTLAYISVALGKPTIFFNQKNEVPREGNAAVNSYGKYKHFLDYPIQLSDMSDKQVIHFSQNYHSLNEGVKQWSCSNIGGAFNADRFLSVIREYVA